MVALILAGAFALAFPSVAGHASFVHDSMLGFNVSAQTFPTDNRPATPLSNMTFEQWWFHDHLAYPPNPGSVFTLPAGGVATAQIGCNKDATTFFDPASGGDIESGDDVCPGSPMSEYHTNGPDDLKGCALAIAYKEDFNATQPEDFTVFSVNQTCVWTRFTDFSVPARLPACPPAGCVCAWFWIHSQHSGGEQNYMNGFRCNVSDVTSTAQLAPPQVPRRCGADPEHGVLQDTPGNCTYGAKQPFYWFQIERNNMFEDPQAPPFYTDLYHFTQGAQNDIFADSYAAPLPTPGPNQTAIPAFLPQGGPAQANSTNVNANPNLNLGGLGAAKAMVAVPSGAAGASSAVVSSATSSSVAPSAGGASASVTSESPTSTASASTSTGVSAAAGASSGAVAGLTSTVIVYVTVTPSTPSVPSAPAISTVRAIPAGGGVATASAFSSAPAVTSAPSASALSSHTLASSSASSPALAPVLPSASPSASPSAAAAASSAPFATTTILLNAAPAPAPSASSAPTLNNVALLDVTLDAGAGAAEPNSGSSDDDSDSGEQGLHTCKQMPSASSSNALHLQRRARAFHATKRHSLRKLTKRADLWSFF